MALIVDTGLHPLVGGMPPPWVSAWGHDRVGPYLELAIGTAVQRLRWIPPGRFEMGSPADEAGGFDIEGPVHVVTLGQGFWLFDTPCTQALWSAVMGDNPSRFKSPARPVERVSFTDVEQFLARINRLVPGLNLELPSEARWEYACRAGTDTPTYASYLDAIAWYMANSGAGSDQGTQPVAQKAPNDWGLHDMLGNVWEWCADAWHDSYDGAPSDGSVWQAGGAAFRVLRGGSWNDDARVVRAAFRLHAIPANRLDYVGFRCARVQDVSPAGAAEPPAGRGKPAERSEPAAASRHARGLPRSR